MLSSFGIEQWTKKLDYFEQHDRKNKLDCLKSLLVETQMLSILLERIKKEVKSMLEKIYIVLENT